MGILPGKGNSSPSDVSANGSVVVGTSGDTAFRWTLSGGIASLPGNTSPGSLGVSVSNDGTVVGYLGLEDDFSAIVRWQAPSTINYIGGGAVLRGGNASGTLFVGTSSTSRGAVWQAGTAQSTVLSLGLASTAYGVSNDGAFVVGTVWDGTQNRAAISSASGDSYLSPGAGEARAITSTGRVVVGSSGPTSATALACSWVKNSGGAWVVLDSLGDLAGGAANSLAVDRSATGTIIGWGTTSAGPVPFIWDSAGGLRGFTTELDNRFIAWRSLFQSLTGVSAISLDGTTVVGWGKNPSGLTEAFRVVFF